MLQYFSIVIFVKQSIRSTVLLPKSKLRKFNRSRAFDAVGDIA
jgi:hypothetical protein